MWAEEAKNVRRISEGRSTTVETSKRRRKLTRNKGNRRNIKE
jgi:hypothetical protein